MGSRDLREVFSTLDALRNQRDDLTSKCERLERDLLAREQEVARLSAENIAKSVTVKRLTDDLRDRDTQLAKSTALLHVSQSSLRELSQQYDRLRTTAGRAAVAEPAPLIAPSERRESLASVSTVSVGERVSLTKWSRGAAELQSSLHELRRTDATLQQTRQLVEGMRGTVHAREVESDALRAQIRRQSAAAVATSIAACLARRSLVDLRRGYDGLLMHARQSWTLEVVRQQSSTLLGAAQERVDWAQRRSLVCRAVNSWGRIAARARSVREVRQRAATAIVRCRLTAVMRVLKNIMAQRKVLERLGKISGRILRRHAVAAWRAGALVCIRGENAQGLHRLQLLLGRACDLVSCKYRIRTALNKWRCHTAAQSVIGMQRKVRNAYAGVSAAIKLRAARRTMRQALTAMTHYLRSQTRRRQIVQRVLTRAISGQLRRAWGNWRLYTSASAGESLQRGHAEGMVASRVARRSLKSHWCAWVGVWLRERRLARAVIKTRAAVLRSCAKRSLRLWGTFAAARVASEKTRRLVDVSLLLLLRRRCREICSQPPCTYDPVPPPLGNTAEPATAEPVQSVLVSVAVRAVSEERCMLRAWMGWRRALCEHRSVLARRTAKASALAKAAAAAFNASRASAMQAWRASVYRVKLYEARSSCESLLARQRSVASDISRSVLHALGRWRQLAIRSSARRRSNHLGRCLGRRADQLARGRSFRLWVAQWRAHALAHSRGAATDMEALAAAERAHVAASSANELRRSRDATALASVAAKWGALSSLLSSRAMQRTRAASTLQSTLVSVVHRRAVEESHTTSKRAVMSAWAQHVATVRTSTALASQHTRAINDLAALHACVRLCLRACVVGTSARSLCLSISSLSTHPEVSQAVGACRIGLWLFDSTKRSLRTFSSDMGSAFDAHASGSGARAKDSHASLSSTSLGRSKGANASSSGMVEAPVGAGLVGAAASHFIGLDDLMQPPRPGRSLLLSANGSILGVSMADAIHDAAYDSRLDAPLRSLYEETSGAGAGEAVTAVLLPCMAEGSSRTRGSAQLVGVLVVGIVGPGTTTGALNSRQLHLADVLAAACATGISRVMAHAQLRHIESMATDAVQRAHRQLQATGSQVGAF